MPPGKLQTSIFIILLFEESEEGRKETEEKKEMGRGKSVIFLQLFTYRQKCYIIKSIQRVLYIRAISRI